MLTDYPLHGQGFSSLFFKSFKKYALFSKQFFRIVNYEKLPSGQIRRTINQRGIDHYIFEFESLLAQGIEPYVTLFDPPFFFLQNSEKILLIFSSEMKQRYHWDLPQFVLDTLGGIESKQFITEYLFYAETCFKYFGKFVKNWITFNEPLVFIIEAFFQPSPVRFVNSKRIHLILISKNYDNLMFFC